MSTPEQTIEQRLDGYGNEFGSKQLTLHQQDFVPATINKVAEDIRSGAIIRLYFRSNPDMRSAFVLASAIGAAGSVSSEFTLRFEPNDNYSGFVIALSQEIAKGSSPTNLSLDLAASHLNRDAVEALAYVITKVKGKLSLDLCSCDLSDKGAILIAEAIRNATELSALSINLGGDHNSCGIREAGLYALAEAMGSIGAPRNLTLNQAIEFSLDGNNLSEIAIAISSKSAPDNLKLTLEFSEDTWDQEEANIALQPIIQAIQAGNCPPRLGIDYLDEAIGRPLIQDHQALHRQGALSIFTLLCINNRMNKRIPIDVLAIIGRMVMPGWWSGPRVPQNGRAFITKMGRFFPNATTAKQVTIESADQDQGQESILKKRKT